MTEKRDLRFCGVCTARKYENERDLPSANTCTHFARCHVQFPAYLAISCGHLRLYQMGLRVCACGRSDK